VATLLPYVLDNFYWRIEAITPTYTDALVVARFCECEPPGIETPGEGSGWARRFWVDRVESGDNGTDTDATARDAEHLYIVNVYYPVPALGGHRRASRVIDFDRHDMEKTLRGRIPAYDHRLGYDDNNSTTNIGLTLRKRRRDGTNKGNPAIWVYSAEWLCSIREDETT